MGNEKRIIPLHSPFLPESIIDAMTSTLRSRWINEGPKVELFEKLFKEKFNLKHALAVNSCTSALRLSFSIAGVSSRDEVITTPYTMEATNTTILEQGAKPVFADIQYETGNIDPNEIEKHITKNTKAIVCVHLAGYPCDMFEIWNIGFSHNIPVIEDCAHALGAIYNNQYIGAFSDMACFSFQAIKHITTGDGGMFVTSYEDYADEARERRWYGLDKKNRYEALITKLGFKYNMNDITATIGVEQMKYVDEVMAKRSYIAKFYNDTLYRIKELTLMDYKPDRISSNWIFPIHVNRMNRFLKKMRNEGVGSSVVANRNDKHPIFGGRRKDLPNTSKIEKDLVCLPNHYYLTEEDLHYIVDTIKKGW